MVELLWTGTGSAGNLRPGRLDGVQGIVSRSSSAGEDGAAPSEALARPQRQQERALTARSQWRRRLEGKKPRRSRGAKRRGRNREEAETYLREEGNPGVPPVSIQFPIFFLPLSRPCEREYTDAFRRSGAG